MTKADATTTQPNPPSGIAETEYSASSGTSSGNCAVVTGWVNARFIFGVGVRVAVGNVESSICSKVVVVEDMLQILPCNTGRLVLANGSI